ncbi:hypothetical protein [Photobacterium lutimaris]|nr:hypothetical protein [Photobacterium lutimaris]TDR74901.1 hypothetical protein DFP78_106232 [Photobacterium lutimaris]
MKKKMSIEIFGFEVNLSIKPLNIKEKSENVRLNKPQTDVNKWLF